jgi:hypothetical protein
VPATTVLRRGASTSPAADVPCERRCRPRRDPSSHVSDHSAGHACPPQTAPPYQLQVNATRPRALAVEPHHHRHLRIGHRQLYAADPPITRLSRPHRASGHTPAYAHAPQSVRESCRPSPHQRPAQAAEGAVAREAPPRFIGGTQRACKRTFHRTLSSALDWAPGGRASSLRSAPVTLATTVTLRSLPAAAYALSHQRRKQGGLRHALGPRTEAGAVELVADLERVQSRVGGPHKRRRQQQGRVVRRIRRRVGHRHILLRQKKIVSTA